MTRNHHLDNAKFILIGAVVFGHLIEPMIRDHSIARVAYLTLYSFHMPGFVMVAGMLSRADLGSDRVVRLVRSVAVPFVVFSVLYELFALATTGAVSSYARNLEPYWIMWFLYSLFIWRLFLGAFLTLRFPLAWACALAIAAGYFESINRFLGASRTIYFFPFFLVGYQLSTSGVSGLKNRAQAPLLTVASAAAVVATPIIIWFSLREHSARWLYGSQPYDQMADVGWEGGLIRVALYAGTFLLTMAVLMLTPSSGGRMAERGGNSLNVYVWHGFVAKTLIEIGLYSRLEQVPEAFVVTLLLLASIALTLVLSSRIVSELTTTYVLQPAQKLLLRSFQ